MRVLQINASYKPAYVYGGPTMSVAKLSEEMILAGVDLEVFTTTANGNFELNVKPGDTVKVDGVNVTYFSRVTKDHSHFSPALLKHLFTTVRNYDAVHIHAWWNLVSVLACWIAISRGVPVVISPRGTLSDYSFHNRNSLAKKFLHRLLGLSLLRKSAIHVTSDREEMAMTALLRRPKIFNIPNFIRLPDNHTLSRRLPGHTLKLLFFSRIEEKKGIEILFKALTTVSVPYHLTIAGDGDAGYVNNLKQLAAKMRLAANITWLGFVNENKFTVIEQHDLLVLPSYDENFGNVVIESLCVGTAVLVSKNVGLAGYIEKARLGWSCVNEPSAFSGAINLVPKKKRRVAPYKARSAGKNKR